MMWVSRTFASIILVVNGFVVASSTSNTTNQTAGVHLSLGNNPTEVVVSWATALMPGHANILVKYGTTKSLGSFAIANTTTLSNNEPATGPGSKTTWRNISMHHAIVPAQAGETVFYSVDDAKIYNFTHLPCNTTQQKPITFAIFGDMGVKEQEGANWTLAMLKQHRRNGEFDAVLHVGDLAYDLRENAGRTGDEFLADMEEVASSVPYLTCVGNHERDCVDTVTAEPIKSCNSPPYTNYRQRFSMPTPSSSANSPLFWSVDIGFVHVIALNTDTYLLGEAMAADQYDAIQAQLKWLEADLEAATARRKQVPWIIAIGHEMLYSTHDSGHVAQAQILREGGTSTSGAFAGLESLLHDYGVDLYFSGHEHVYEHFGRIYKGAACTAATAGTKCGMTASRTEGCPCTAHIIVGNAGNREFPYKNTNGTVAGFAYPQPSYEQFRSAFPSGYGLLTVYNATTMAWQQMNAITGQPIDVHVYSRGPV
eukprot:m.137597 g.137597  ORF g.137597 m.137597 type:complete len:482 (-) comp29929_c0_seq1:35-1480(-)